MDGWVGWFLAPFHINWSGLGVVGGVGLGDGEQDEELDGESFIEDGISSFSKETPFHSNDGGLFSGGGSNP